MSHSNQVVPNELPSHPCMAAVDLGSNSFHMLVARLDQGTMQPLLKHKERVKLAAGLDLKLHLGEQAILRGLACLERINERLQGFDNASVRIVATHTLRASKNRDDFLQRAEAILGYPIEVISGHEEARLIFQGVSHIESFDDKALVIDIGGGSTEIAVGRKYQPKYLSSRSMGCVSFSKQFFADHITDSAFESAIIAAKQALEDMPHNFVGDNWQNAFATSGTAKALSMAILSNGHEDGVLTPRRLRKLTEQLCADKAAPFLQILSAERASVFPGGLAVMIAVMETLKIEAIRYSEAALREGVLYEMEAKMRHGDIKLRTRQSLQLRYAIDSEHGNNVADLCSHLWHACRDAWQLPESTFALLQHAAHLHEIGLQVNASNLQRHSAYVLANTDLPGFNQQEQQLIAALVAQYRKRLQPELLPQLRSFPREILLSLLRILRLAVLLNIDRTGFDVTLLQASAKKQKLTLQFADNLLDSKPLLQADLKREAQMLKKHDLTLVYD